MRFVHISDIHISAMPGSMAAWFDKRALGILNFQLFRRQFMRYAYLERARSVIGNLEPDWLVITGDLTCTGSPEEFAQALESLHALRGGATPTPCIYVPGNHDAYVRDGRCAEALRKAFFALNDGRWTLDADSHSAPGLGMPKSSPTVSVAAPLPAELTLPGLSVLVLNECRPTLPWLSSGALSPAARDRFGEWVSRPRKPGEKRMIIGHYPCRQANGRRFDWRRRLDDDQLLQTAFAAGQIDVALCGHCHTPFVRAESAGTMEICAGALTVHGRINVLDYAPQTGRFTQFWQDLSAEGPGLIPLATATV